MSFIEICQSWQPYLALKERCRGQITRYRWQKYFQRNKNLGLVCCFDETVPFPCIQRLYWKVLSLVETPMATPSTCLYIVLLKLKLTDEVAAVSNSVKVSWE